jgi:hypothetical protein
MLVPKTFFFQNHFKASIGGSLIKINDNRFAIGASESTDISAGPPFPPTAYGRSVLLEVDSLGNVLSLTKSQKNEQTGIIGLHRLSDGWLYGSAKLGLVNPATFSKSLTIVKTGEDINNIVWEKVISVSTDSYNQCLDIKPTPDGNWVAVSQLIVNGPPPPEFGPSYLAGGVYKISPEGDSIWSRIDTVFWHPDCGADNYLGGVATLSSGSIVAAGYANSYCYTNVRTYGWVLKLSKDGCIDTLCVTTDLNREPNVPEIIVYPNPTPGIVNIAGCDNCEVAIYDMFGRLVQKYQFDNRSLDLSLLTYGAYFLKIKKQGRIVKMDKIIKYR